MSILGKADRALPTKSKPTNTPALRHTHKYTHLFIMFVIHVLYIDGMLYMCNYNDDCCILWGITIIMHPKDTILKVLPFLVNGFDVLMALNKFCAILNLIRHYKLIFI